MDKFVLNTGIKRIAIYENETDEANGIEPRGVFQFNPKDVSEARKLMELQGECQKEFAELKKKEEECKTEYDQIKYMEEFARGYHKKIDYIYGEGTSYAVFGKALTYDSLIAFFGMLNEKYTEFSKKRVDAKLEELQ